MEELSKLSPSDVAQSEQQFYDIVTKSYLPELCNYEIVPHRMTEDGRPSIENKKRFRWIKINEIIYDKDEFFVDKYSMLFVALHNIASQVAVYIRREKNATIHFYIGVRDINDETNDQSKLTLISGLHGYFPGISFTDAAPEEIAFEKEIENNPHLKDRFSIAAVSGIATLKDEKKGNFIQGIERLLNSVQVEMSVLIIADRVDALNVQKTRLAYETLYSNLSPLAERQLSCHNDYSKSVSETISKNFSLATIKTIGKTITNGVNTSQNSQQGEGRSENVGIGFILSTQDSYSSHSSIGSQIGHHRDVADVLSDAVQRTEGNSKTKGTQETTTTGNSIQVTFSNRKVKSLLDLLDKHIERIECSIPYGMWACSTYFIGTDKTRTKAQANVYVGGIVGEQSNLEKCVVNTWTDSNVVDYLRDISHPLFKYPNSETLLTPASTVDSKELSIHLSLPQTSVPGIIVKERASFGRNVTKSNKSESDISIGTILHLGRENKTQKVELDANELCKHTFITGTTGSGKSNTMYLLVNDLVAKDIPCLIIEPAKGEYKNVFGNIKKDKGYLFDVYGSNPKTTELLRINPFEFSNEIHVYEHIDRLVDIFNACWPMYAAMPVVLKKSICDAYEKCGWDLIKSEWMGDKSIGILYPTINDVVISLRDFINSSEYSDNTKGDYKGSIETRLVSLSEGLTGMMLNNTRGNIEDEQLFKKNVIIDLSKIGNSETKSLLMGLVIMKMTEYYQSHDAMNSELKHVTIMEEAHNLLKRTSTAQSQESSNLAGKSVEMICNSIAEMRTYGEGFIIVDQSPSQVDMAAIRNTNTKIIMALPDYEDRTVAGKSIGLTDNQIEEIGKLSVGQAVVYQNDWEEAVLCKITNYNENTSKEEQKKFIPRNVNNESYYDNDKKGQLTILKFLYRYCGGKTDSQIEDIHDIVFSIDLPSIIKFRLLDIELRSGTPSDKQRHDAIELAANVIGGMEAVSRLMCNRKNEKELFSILQDSLEKDFPGEGKDFYRFCMRSILRVQASLSSKNVETYNNWFRVNYGTNN